MDDAVLELVLGAEAIIRVLQARLDARSHTCEISLTFGPSFTCGSRCRRSHPQSTSAHAIFSASYGILSPD